MIEDTSAKETALCQSCGLCCDGTFFTSTPLDESSEEGEIPSDSKEERVLHQPCRHFSCEQGCSIYGVRPHSCVNFRCCLLQKLRDNEVSLADAKRIVNLTKRHRDEILAALDAKATFLKPMPLKTKFRMVFFGKGFSPKKNMKEDPEAYLAYGGLERLIRKHFLTSKGKSSADESGH
ncbi:YkgJ family cysteine cluster protein [bacterium]|nr:YkgJ family cysteine cluster protein [bacterium]MDB4796574.1 YkgJ family cysteine cluster protein [bacterium]